MSNVPDNPKDGSAKPQPVKPVRDRTRVVPMPKQRRDTPFSKPDTGPPQKNYSGRPSRDRQPQPRFTRRGARSR